MFDEEVIPEYVSPDLPHYAEKVKAILEDARQPVTYGFIHARLEPRRDLTPIALERIGAIRIPGYIEKFCLPEFMPEVKVTWSGELDQFGACVRRGSRWVNRS